MADVFERVSELRRGRQPFVVATVVGRRAPVSSHLGDRAVVLADGRMEGFVGGSCSREIVRSQALAALAVGRPRLVSIRPDADERPGSDPEHVTVRMGCASEGAVDVFLEPITRPRRLVVAGATPVARALSAIGRALDYDVVRAIEPHERADIEAEEAAAGGRAIALDELADIARNAAPEGVAVVASHGHYDEDALERLLPAGLLYVGLVASRKRGDTIRAFLEERGTPNLNALRYPAGLDLGARAASEVALSILAEIVQVAAGSGPSASRVDEASASDRAATAPSRTALDPVCGMEVVVATARHQAEVDGITYYFCCPHCRADFIKDPQLYAAPRS